MTNWRHYTIFGIASAVIAAATFSFAATPARSKTLLVNHLDPATFLLRLLTTPDVDQIAFDINGGSLNNGIKIGRIIRSMGLKTIIPKDAACLSACAEAFIGGVSYEINGVLGFHIPHIATNYSSPDEFSCGLEAGVALAMHHQKMGLSDLNVCILAETSMHVFVSFNSTEDFINRAYSLTHFEILSGDHELVDN